MTDEYTRSVLARAQALRETEAALQALDARAAEPAWHTWLAAALAALMALLPSVSAAGQLIL